MYNFMKIFTFFPFQEVSATPKG